MPDGDLRRYDAPLDGYGVLTTLRQDPVTAIIPFILSPRPRHRFAKAWIWEQMTIS